MTDDSSLTKFLRFDDIGDHEPVDLRSGNCMLRGFFREFAKELDPEKQLIKLEFVLCRSTLDALKEGGLPYDGEV